MEHFRPYLAITLVHWNPVVCAPGAVSDDLRIIYDPRQRMFALSSISWINEFRKTSPIDLSRGTLEDVRRYILELVSLTRRVDNYGFRIRSIERQSNLAFTIDYVLARVPSASDRLFRDNIRFMVDGGIEQAAFLTNEHLEM